VLDDETKHRIRQVAEEIARLQHAKEEAVARKDFEQAAKVRDKVDQYWRELRSLKLPDWVWKNVERLAHARASIFPLLKMLHDEAGEPDAGVLSKLPNPLAPPIKIVVGTVPRFPVSTIRALLALDDIGSPYFQALVPMISPELVAKLKGDKKAMTQFAFSEIVRAITPAVPYLFNPVLLCITCLTTLPHDVRDEVYAGLHRTNCDFVVFEADAVAPSLLGSLPHGTKLMEP